MIKIENKQDCCGCSACAQRCPKHCISFREDTEGFLYPHVDASECIDCGLCEQVCPMLHQPVAERKPLAVYAARIQNEKIRLTSSSGCVFTALAEEIIREGGVVFGASFNADWEVVHDYTETVSGLSKFRGSKYVQSRIGDSYMLTESFLKAGRKVLFSGTPCQIAGLKKFLRKDYANLLPVDVICHGVPSPGVWREYLKDGIMASTQQKKTAPTHSIHEKDITIESISFRDKTLGWKKSSFSIVLSTTDGSGEKLNFCSCTPYTENIYTKGFLANLYLRPSCHKCPIKCGKSGSSLTIGDFWGLQSAMPELDDDKGTTALLVMDTQGKYWVDKIDIESWITNYENVLKGNPPLEVSARIPRNRKLFFKSASKSIEVRIKKCLRPTAKQQIKSLLRKTVGRVLKNMHRP